METAATKTATVLIVDDDNNIRTSIRVCLEDAGYIVKQAVNGADALEQIQRKPPDVVLLDLAMPVMDGMTVLAEIRNLWPNYATRVIVITAHGSVKTAINAIRLGASDFLEKPFTPEDLRLSVAAILEESPGRDRAMVLPTAGEIIDHDTSCAMDAPALLRQFRADLSKHDLVHAGSLVMRGAELEKTMSSRQRAGYFNLLGLLHEAEGRLLEARALYRKAIAADRDYMPPQDNAWRIYDVLGGGSTDIPVALGDDAELAELRRVSTDHPHE